MCDLYCCSLIDIVYSLTETTFILLLAAGDGRWGHHRCIPAADRWTLLSPLPPHWRPPSNHACINLHCLIAHPSLWLLLFYYYYFLNLKISVVFCQVRVCLCACVWGGGRAPQLFMYHLSQDWTLVCVNSLCAGQSGPPFPLDPAGCEWTKVFATAPPGLSVPPSLPTESLACGSLSWFSSITVGHGSLQEFVQGHSQWAQKVGNWKCGLNFKHACLPIHTAFLYVFFVTTVTPALRSERYFNSLCILDAFAKEFGFFSLWGINTHWAFFFFFPVQMYQSGT